MFKILKQINETPGINQRALSNKCEISLGKVNSLIEDLENNNFIKKDINGREHKYFIQERGLKFLENELKNKGDIKLKLHNDEVKKINTAVILAAGRNSNFDIPVAMLEINEVSLIERMIQLLRKNEIDNIYVVCGYKSELIRRKLDNSIILIENEDFKWTSTMASLSKVSEYIKDDFLLVEGDIIIEEEGIREIINYKKRDCILITSESGSGDEGFVEIRNNSVYKISKDIAQLNKIDGEMIGISKLSYEFYKKMLEIYKDNRNPYMNYEYMMLDVSKTYSLGYIKLDNLLWHEIDNLDHYSYIKTKLINKIKKKEESVMFKNLKKLVCECMDIEESRVQSIYPIGGMTNRNYKVKIDDRSYVLRIPGSGTDSMINRKDEIKNAVYANNIGIDTKLIYFNENTGIKISTFIEEAETLTPKSAKKQTSIEMVVNILRKLHKSQLKMENEFNVYEKIELYEQLLIDFNGNNFEDYYEVKNKILKLKEIMNELDVELVPCHNDTVSENFIKSGEDKMYLIDWEYGGMNDPMWDLAAYSLENDLSNDQEELLLKLYFDGEVLEKYNKRILINKIYQDFLWSIWTNVKEAKGDNFGTYGIDRYNRAKRNLKIILGEEK